MRVRIVDKTDDVKEMTIEELAGREFVGVEIGVGTKYMLSPYGGGWAFLGPTYYLGSGSRQNLSKADAIREMYARTGAGYRLYRFNTAKELYLWMAK